VLKFNDPGVEVKTKQNLPHLSPSPAVVSAMEHVSKHLLVYDIDRIISRLRKKSLGKREKIGRMNSNFVNILVLLPWLLACQAL
jgi:hypothetical protein